MVGAARFVKQTCLGPILFARGGFRRYLGWTVARLPIPHDWARARELLAPLGRRGVGGEAVGGEELLDAVVAAYRVDPTRLMVDRGWRVEGEYRTGFFFDSSWTFVSKATLVNQRP